MRKTIFGKLALTVIVPTLLIILHKTGWGTSVTSRILDAFGPIMRVSLNAQRQIRSMATSESTKEAVRGLETLEILSAGRMTIEKLKEENERLRSMVNFEKKHDIHVMGAAVWSYGQELGGEFLLIDRGKNDGVKKNDLVIDAQGIVVGSIKDVENTFARVSVASNPEEVYEGELIPLGEKVFAKGMGSRTFSLELIAQNIPVRRGDFLVVTAPMGYTAYVMGQIVRAATSSVGAFKEVRAVLVARPELIDEVFIVSPTK